MRKWKAVVVNYLAQNTQLAILSFSIRHYMMGLKANVTVTTYVDRVPMPHILTTHFQTPRPIYRDVTNIVQKPRIKMGLKLKMITSLSPHGTTLSHNTDTNKNKV